MFNFDIFPEDRYDPSSGEFDADFNFEPVPIDDVKLTSDITAQVFTIGDETEGQRVADLLRQYANAGIFEDTFDPKNPQAYAPMPDDLDRSNKRTVRGPFDKDSLESFLNKSGLRNVGVPYYDEAYDEFWVDIDTE